MMGAAKSLIKDKCVLDKPIPCKSCPALWYDGKQLNSTSKFTSCMECIMIHRPITLCPTCNVLSTKNPTRINKVSLDKDVICYYCIILRYVQIKVIDSDVLDHYYLNTMLRYGPDFFELYNKLYRTNNHTVRKEEIYYIPLKHHHTRVEIICLSCPNLLATNIFSVPFGQCKDCVKKIIKQIYFTVDRRVCHCCMKELPIDCPFKLCNCCMYDKYGQGIYPKDVPKYPTASIVKYSKKRRELLVGNRVERRDTIKKYAFEVVHIENDNERKVIRGLLYPYVIEYMIPDLSVIVMQYL
jgi:hypothetical protein